MKPPSVTVGSWVKKGQEIGVLSGLSGTPCTTGPHLHFNLDKALESIDPMCYEYKANNLNTLDKIAAAKLHSILVFAVDPNAMHGPEGYVIPGQTMTYSVEFENVGEGDAYGVYVTDTLDSNLDETSLSVRDFKLVDWATNVETTTTFSYTFDQLTRTITVQTGDFTSKKGGKFTIEARLKTALAAGTVIPNFATVYFPNVLEKTPTNTIISVVPQQPSIAYLGSTQVHYADYAVLRSSLTMDGQNIVGKTVNYSVATATFSAITDAKNLGASELVTRLTVTPGTYTVTAAFPGDGYYYLSSTTTATMEVLKGYTVIPEFSTTSYSTGTITLPISLYDSNGAALLNQDTSPKTIYLEYQDSETWKSLGQMAISTDTANFEFAPPQPIQREYNIRARFPGDDYYEAIESTGTLILAARSAMTIDSPVAGTIYTSSVPVQYAFTDIFDSSASATSYFTRLADGTTIYALNNSTVPVFELAPGSWTFTMQVTEQSGYMASSTTASFEVIADTIPPVTTLLPDQYYYYGVNSLYLSSKTYVTLAPTDAISGAYGAYYTIDPSTSVPALSLLTTSQFTLYTSTFNAVGEGYHYLSYGAIDYAGNAELLHSATVYMDASAPLLAMSVAGVQASTGAVIYMPAVSTISLTAADPLVAGDASGMQAISYLVDKQPADCAGIMLDSSAVAGTCANPAYAGPFTLSPGMHTLYAAAADRVDNRTVFTSTVVVDGLHPGTGLAFSSYTLYGSIPYVSSGAYIVLTSADDLAVTGDNAGLGVSSLRWRIGAGEWNVVSDSEPAQGKVVSSTITLAGMSDGVYTLQYFAEDKLGQIEPVRVSTFALSFTAPVVTISSPSAGSVFARSVRGAVPVAFSVSDAVDSNPTVAARLVEVQDEGLLNGATVMAVTNGVSVPAVSLDDGVWRLEVFAQNLVGNSSSVFSSTFQIVNPPSARWGGGAGNANWLSAANWTGGMVPTSDVDVVIDSNVVVTANAPVSFNSLVLGGTNSPTFKLSAGTVDAGSLVVKNKATFEQNTVSTVAFYSVMVESGGKLTHTANTTSKAYQLNIQTVSDFTLQAGATVYMDALGYAGVTAANGNGPGGGKGDMGHLGSGGGHGGAGGLSGEGSIGGAVNDSILNPIELGSSGGGSNGAVSGSGGGAIVAAIGGAAHLNGLITANGGVGGSGTWSAGGGSGGTINISAGSIDGNGQLQANGGSRGASTVAGGGGGGGGGRVAVGGLVYPSSITVSVLGGNGYQSGGTGTVYDKTFYPPSFSGHSVATGTIIWSWGDTAAESFRILSTTGGYISGLLARDTTSYVEIGLLPNTTYSRLLTAYTSLVSTTTMPAGASSLASRVTVNSDALTAISSIAISATWDALPASPSTATAEGYVLELSTTNFGVNAPGGVVISSVTSNVALNALRIGGLEPLTTYYARVGSLNWDGVANYTGLVSTQTHRPIIHAISSVTPSSAPVGELISIAGTDFEEWASTSTTVVLLASAPVQVSSWTDTGISAILPYVSTGQYVLTVERLNGDSSVAWTATSSFTVTAPEITGLSPSYGDPGAAFTLTGTSFGTYNSAQINGNTMTRVMMDGTVSCALSSWNDTEVRGVIPDDAATGNRYLTVVREVPAGTQTSNALAFDVGGSGRQGLMSHNTAGAFSRTNVASDPNAGLMLKAAWGGHVESASRAAVDMPANALARNTFITLATATVSGELSARMTDSESKAYIMPVSSLLAFGPEKLELADSAKITLPYDAEKLPAGKGVADLAIFKWDDSSGAWVELETSLVGGRLVAYSRSMSLYQSMVRGMNPPPSAEFVFRQFYVYPNPAKGGKRPVLHLECGIGDSMDIRIYDVAGELRHSARLEGLPQVSSPEYAYEYVWDMGGAGSGVYSAIVVAHKNGYGDIKARKKFAIVR